MPRRNALKVKPTGITVLLWGIVALIIVNLLARFNLIDFTGFQPDILTLIAIFFVAAEIGVMAALRGKKKLDGIRWFGLIVVILAFVGLILSWVNLSFPILESMQGFVDLALLVFVVIEIFR